MRSRLTVLLIEGPAQCRQLLRSSLVSAGLPVLDGEKTNSLARSRRASLSLLSSASESFECFGAPVVCRVCHGVRTTGCAHLRAERPVPGGGRPDIRLTNGRRVVHLESKVEAELTLKQLKKYRESSVKVLIAMTKYRPDVPPAELWQHRIRRLCAVPSRPW